MLDSDSVLGIQLSDGGLEPPEMFRPLRGNTEPAEHFS